MAEKVAWVAIGLVLMLSAHLIPALTRAAGRVVRLAAIVVWALAVVATGYTHATFFVNAQRHAGEARAAHIGEVHAAPESVDSRGRPIEQIANDRARVERDLASVGIARCTRDCAAVAARKASLEARLIALNIELDAARRRMRIADDAAAASARVLARQDAAIVDPVVSRLAQLVNVGTGTLDLILALAMGWLLEAIACVSWFVAFLAPTVPLVSFGGVADRSPSASRLASAERIQGAADAFSTSATPVVAPRDAPAANDCAASSESMAERADASQHSCDAGTGAQEGLKRDEGRLDTASELERLAHAMRDGAVRPTIAGIRSYVGCTEGRAVALRRQLAVLNPELLSHGISPAA
ncbi:hypothetical protein ACV229_16425 [Burkholderia sp. MR1-5-21]